MIDAVTMTAQWEAEVQGLKSELGKAREKLKVQGQCQHEDCTEPATERVQKNPVIMLLCELHCDLEISDGNHEYTESCLNCGTAILVN